MTQSWDGFITRIIEINRMDLTEAQRDRLKDLARRDYYAGRIAPAKDGANMDQTAAETGIRWSREYISATSYVDLVTKAWQGVNGKFVAEQEAIGRMRSELTPEGVEARLKPIRDTWELAFANVDSTFLGRLAAWREAAHEQAKDRKSPPDRAAFESSKCAAIQLVALRVPVASPPELEEDFDKVCLQGIPGEVVGWAAALVPLMQARVSAVRDVGLDDGWADTLTRIQARAADEVPKYESAGLRQAVANLRFADQEEALIALNRGQMQLRLTALNLGNGGATVYLRQAVGLPTE